MALDDGKLAIYFPESYQKTPCVGDDLQGAVCKIESPYKQGTAFLIESKVNDVLRRGLIACHHVACIDNKGRPIVADLYKIQVTDIFLEKKSSPWGGIRDDSWEPISDPTLDFFYVDVSCDFQKSIVDNELRFLDPRYNLVRCKCDYFLITGVPKRQLRSANFSAPNFCNRKRPPHSRT